jgi:hypothetical protein
MLSSLRTGDLFTLSFTLLDFTPSSCLDLVCALSLVAAPADPFPDETAPDAFDLADCISPSVV